MICAVVTGVESGLCRSLVGRLVAWGGRMPVLTAAQAAVGSVDAVVGAGFSQQVRFIGAGTIGVAALWTLLKIIGPIVKGIQGSIASSDRKSTRLNSSH